MRDLSPAVWRPVLILVTAILWCSLAIQKPKLQKTRQASTRFFLQPSLTHSVIPLQGNVAFKSGDYPTAIGHYTTAILANKSDVTYPLNRAAAYLKLGKYVFRFYIICQKNVLIWYWLLCYSERRNEDAERDCSRVLELSPDNVKALFRRSQARIGMGYLTEAHIGVYRYTLE